MEPVLFVPAKIKILDGSWPAGLHPTGEDNNIMPQSNHDRAAELHNLASHAHTVAAEAHGKADHLTAHELSRQALEHSLSAHKHSEQLFEETKKIPPANRPEDPKPEPIGLPG